MKKQLGWGAALAAVVLVACAGESPDDVGTSNDEIRTAQTCGGIAGIQCPKGYACVDDTADDCDPKNGGADCGGICVPSKCFPERIWKSTDPQQCMAMKFACEAGRTFFSDKSGCGCACAADSAPSLAY